MLVHCVITEHGCWGVVVLQAQRGLLLDIVSLASHSSAGYTCVIIVHEMLIMYARSLAVSM